MTGIEPWAISAVSGVAAMVFQSGGHALEGLGKTLDEKTKKLIFAASNQYEKNYEQRHGILKVLGMREPVKLESLYRIHLTSFTILKYSYRKSRIQQSCRTLAA
ncbi:MULTISPECIES: hypothetical protein [Nostoc]|uniref:Uncharacterized protein n=2 Tax=Nostoc TaxID=1177 RepID=A0ABR8IFX0_9NOSO|nr:MULTISPECIES: hypothetical protein [Nostoc]MBD2563266.1 hypothetical protein [Nostoc linckia FACHB-391]MBD2650491.1 hypothetical protein [Nostoc foliaceum FACHB-393]